MTVSERRDRKGTLRPRGKNRHKKPPPQNRQKNTRVKSTAARRPRRPGESTAKPGAGTSHSPPALPGRRRVGAYSAGLGQAGDRRGSGGHAHAALGLSQAGQDSQPEARRGGARGRNAGRLRAKRGGLREPEKETGTGSFVPP